jgi:hypothetical protein
MISSADNVKDFGSSRHAAIGSVSVPFGEQLKTRNSKADRLEKRHLNHTLMAKPRNGGIRQPWRVSALGERFPAS